MTSFEADCSSARVQPSPNHGERADGRRPDMILLHYTGMPTADGALDWLCRAESQVSSHYFVHENGEVVQLVPETRRAWHAGKSSWHGETDINSLSIGIEIANAGHPGGLPDYPKEQIAAVIELCRDCVKRWSITPERVLGHSDVAPIRKVDPGEKFPGPSSTGQASGTGSNRQRSPAGASSSAAIQASLSRRCNRCCHSMVTALKSRVNSPKNGGRRESFPAPFPARTGGWHRRFLDDRHAAPAAFSIAALFLTGRAGYQG